MIGIFALENVFFLLKFSSMWFVEEGVDPAGECLVAHLMATERFG